MSTLMDEFGHDDDPNDRGRQGDTRPRRAAGPPSRRPKRGMSPFTAVGLLLLIAGLASLGWVAYQYFGTNAAAEQAFKDEKSQLREEWDQQPDQGSKEDKKETKGSVIPGKAIALLRIPALGKDYEVPILAGTDEKTLSRGIGHYDKTADPGQLGNFVIAGHRVTHGQPFARLLELKAGDEIVIETRDAIYTYALDTPPSDLTVKANETWVTDPVPGTKSKKASKAALTLITCEDLFHSPDRSIGFGHLIDTERKSKAS
ncbi:class E sortase [Microlunatus parietis]|uniref:Sortase A n=1 Tax=Microlunatus parietis TaxID=682979 RepID=A0A7Y9I9J8_9ACTN|nr:class E sortase [Microlunatus parietis]NYE72770.1 sortase A [Microlunatus parietis]